MALADYYVNLRLCTDSTGKNKNGNLRESIGKKEALYMITDASKACVLFTKQKPSENVFSKLRWEWKFKLKIISLNIFDLAGSYIWSDLSLS